MEFLIQKSSNNLNICFKNIEEIDQPYLKGLTFHYVSSMKEVLEIAITNKKVKNFKKLNV